MATINPPDNKRHIFVSYSSADREFVTRLIADLQTQGVNIWIDKQGLKLGTRNWEQALRDAISASSAVLLIATPDSRQSNYVQDELAIADMYQRPIYPVWAAGQRWLDCVPMGMGKYQFLDARGDAYATVLPEIIRTLSFTAENASPVPDITAPPVRTTPIVQPEPRDGHLIHTPRNPYKGLRAFTSIDTSDFFGREYLVSGLVDSLRQQLQQDKNRLMALIGPSGSGKSSVIMAGVLPSLKDNALNGSSEWAYMDTIVPGAHPLESLVVALSNALPERSGRAILEDLNDPSSRGLHMIARQIARQSATKVAIFIDQFEEVFTQATDEQERQQFIDLLVTAATEPGGPFVVLLTMRADFYDRPMAYPRLCELLKEHQPVVPMSLADLYDVVQKPATLPDVQIAFDEGLVAELVFEVREQSGALPLLQFTLDQLFRRRQGNLLTIHAYREMGGVRGALAGHAETTYSELVSNRQQTLVRMLFLRLIEPGATEQDTTRRRAELSEFDLHDAADSRIMSEVIDIFTTRARLLTTSEVSGRATIEVSHEALLREWKRLAHWVQEAREDIRFQKSLSEDVTEWSRRNRPTDRLYRGTTLAEAQEWAARNTPSRLEATFIEESQAAEKEAQRREQRRQRSLNQARLGVAIALLALALGGVIFFAMQTQQAAEAARQFANQAGTATFALGQAEIASTEVAHQATQANDNLRESQNNQALVLANLTNTLSDDNSQRALLLALRALENYPEVQNEQSLLALRRVLNQRFIQISQTPARTGINLSIVNFEESPDGERVAVTYSDGVTWIWDFEDSDGLPLLYSAGMYFVDSRQTFPKWSPDGKYLVAVSYCPVISRECVVRVWDAATGAEKTLLRHLSSVSGFLWNDDGSRLLTWTFGGEIFVWDGVTFDPIWVGRHAGTVNGVEWSPDNRAVLSRSSDGTAQVRDAESGNLLQVLRHRFSILNATWSPDGKRILTGSGDTTAMVWDAATGAEQFTLRHSSSVGFVNWSPSARYIVTADRNYAYMWDGQTGKIRYTMSQLSSNALQWTSDETFLVIGNSLIEAATGRVFNLGSSNNPMLTIPLSPDETFVLSGTLLRRIDEIALPNNQQNTFNLGGVVKWSVHNGEFLSTSTQTGGVSVIRWRITTGPASLTMRYKGINGAFWNPDGRSLLSWSEDGNVHFWDAVSGEVLSTLPHGEAVGGAAWNSGGNLLLTWSRGGPILRLWDPDQEKLLHTWTHEARVDGAIWDAQGERVLSWSDDGSARLWDITAEQALFHFDHDGPVTGASWSPDERSIVTWSDDGTARLWDSQTGELRHVLEHEWYVNGAQWHSSNSRLLTWSSDRSVRLWDTQTGTALETITLRASPRAANWSPDGQHIVTWVPYEMRVWSAEDASLEYVQNFYYNLLPGVYSPDQKRFWMPNASVVNVLLPTAVPNSPSASYNVFDALSYQFVTGTEFSTLTGENGVWSPDGKRLMVWNCCQVAVSGSPSPYTLNIPRPAGGAWSADSSQLMVWSRDGAIYVVPVEIDDMLTLARSRVFRELSPLELQSAYLATIVPTPTSVVSPTATLTPANPTAVLNEPAIVDATNTAIWELLGATVTRNAVATQITNTPLPAATLTALNSLDPVARTATALATILNPGGFVPGAATSTPSSTPTLNPTFGTATPTYATLTPLPTLTETAPAPTLTPLPTLTPSATATPLPQVLTDTARLTEIYIMGNALRTPTATSGNAP